MKARLRRLEVDHERVGIALREHPCIRVLATAGQPPDAYRIEYTLRSVLGLQDEKLDVGPRHVAEIVCPPTYPKQPAFCKMLTPLFHPNVEPGSLEIGSLPPDQTLVEVVFRIARLLAYQQFDTEHAYNAEAAAWAEANPGLFPFDSAKLATPAIAAPSTPGVKVCQFCGHTSATVRVGRCRRGHNICQQCGTLCNSCRHSACFVCGTADCHDCHETACLDCATTCFNCGVDLCRLHTYLCSVCHRGGCKRCAPACVRCGQHSCVEHVMQCASCEEPLCNSCWGNQRKCPKCDAEKK